MATPTLVGNAPTLGGVVAIASGTATGISTDYWGNLIINSPLIVSEVPLENGSLNFFDEFCLVNATGQSSPTFPIAAAAGNVNYGGTFDVHGSYFYASSSNVMEMQINGYNFGSVPLGTLKAGPYTDAFFMVSSQNASHIFPAYTMNNTGPLSLLQSFPFSGNKSFTGGTTLSPGTSVDIEMNFQPVHAGLLKGGYVPLNGNNGNAPWTTVNLQGIGAGPQPFFLPGTASQALALSQVYTTSAHTAKATTFTPGGMAVDTFGDIFVVDTANHAVDVDCLASTANAASSTVNTGVFTGSYCTANAGFRFLLVRAPLSSAPWPSLWMDPNQVYDAG